MFDFGEWLQVALPVSGMLVPINMALVQFLGKFVSGNAQLAAGGISGLILGIAASFAFWGLPSDFLGWFLAVVFGLIVFGASVGTYEAVKHAASNAGS